MTRRRLFAALLLSGASVASAQAPRPVDPAQAQRGTPSRLVSMLQHAQQVSDWAFYYSVADLPPEVHALLTRFTGRAVANPGQRFNTTDFIDLKLPNAQLQFAAEGDNLTVIVWYANGGIVAPFLNVLVYDRTARDAIRYTVSGGGVQGALQLNDLLSLLLAGNPRARHDYLRPGELQKP